PPPPPRQRAPPPPPQTSQWSPARRKPRRKRSSRLGHFADNAPQQPTSPTRRVGRRAPQSCRARGSCPALVARTPPGPARRPPPPTTPSAVAAPASSTVPGSAQRKTRLPCVTLPDERRKTGKAPR